MDRLQSMQIFARVVEMHSFGRAADSLSLPPSRVTRAVKELEAFLGVCLLRRTTRHISLTPTVRCTTTTADACWRTSRQ